MNNAITTHRLTKYYARKRAVNSLTLNIPTGCVYGLLGRNGAGKSTTIKMLVGMIHPDFGSAKLLGDDSEDLPPRTRARIAYIAEGHPLFDWMTIGQIIKFTMAFYPNAKREFIDQIMDHFGLSKKSKIRRLSKGQKAQVSLALALAPDPELLILDDPTIGLDTAVRRDFLESMIHLIQRRGRTILLSSHILNDVERVADRVGVMVDGVLRVDCPLDHFKQSVSKVILEFDGEPPTVPPCNGLLHDWKIGSRRELVIIGFGNGQRESIEKLQPRKMEVINLNLEDAFIEYTRSKGKLPIPLAGASHD